EHADGEHPPAVAPRGSAPREPPEDHRNPVEEELPQHCLPFRFPSPLAATRAERAAVVVLATQRASTSWKEQPLPFAARARSAGESAGLAASACSACAWIATSWPMRSGSDRRAVSASRLGATGGTARAES